MKNNLNRKERFLLLTTASYLNPVVNNKENLEGRTSFGAKCFELEGNEECELSFELIVESYLDRIKQHQVVVL